MWDWGRKGLDGLPRPVHLEHAANNIQFDRQTDFAKKLVNVYQKETPNISKQKRVKTEKTGLNDLEFMKRDVIGFQIKSSFKLIQALICSTLLRVKVLL